MTGQQRPRLTGVTFNAHGAAGGRARGMLEAVLDDAGYPEYLAGQELHAYAGGVRDYVRVAADSHPRELAANCVLYLRDDVEVLRRRVVAVDGPDWLVVQHRTWKPPRVFPGATVAHAGIRWTLLNVHRCTNGLGTGINVPAYRAEDAHLSELVDRVTRRRPTHPVLLAGDHNARGPYRGPYTPHGFAGRYDRGDYALRGVDGLVGVNVRCHAERLEDKHGSDHHPVILTATHTPGDRP